MGNQQNTGQALPLDPSIHRYPEVEFTPFSSIQDNASIKLFTYLYAPVANTLDLKLNNAKAVVIMFHGLSQHLGNSAHIAHDLANKGYIVCGYDQRGFGQSEGIPGYVDGLDLYVSDAVAFIGIVRKLYPDHKVFLCGESLGGLVSYLVGLKHREMVDGVILLNAALGPTPASEKFGFIAKGLGSVFTSTRLLPRVWGRNSKNPTVENYLRYQDTHYYRGWIRPGTLRNITIALEESVQTFAQFDCPVLIVQGGKDTVVDEKHARALCEQAKTSDKELLYLENMWHCSWLEPEIVEIIPKMIEWLDGRV